jgi:hypothetical protein
MQDSSTAAGVSGGGEQLRVELDGLVAELDVLDLAAPLSVELICVLGVPLPLDSQRCHLLFVVEAALRVQIERPRLLLPLLRCTARHACLGVCPILRPKIEKRLRFALAVLPAEVLQPHHGHVLLLRVRLLLVLVGGSLEFLLLDEEQLFYGFVFGLDFWA